MSQVALTTIFTPPASCFNNVYTSTGISIYEKDISITSSQCYPSGFDSLFASSKPFSPGVCPSGYTDASQGGYGHDATAVLCCPSGMTAYQDGGLGCNTQLTAPFVVSIAGASKTISTGQLAMHGVYIAWAASDLSLFTPKSAPLRTIAMQIPSSTSSSSSSSPSKQRSTTSTAPTRIKDPGTRSTASPKTKETVTSATSTSNSNAGSGAGSTTTVSPHPTSLTPSSHKLSPGTQAGIGVAVGLAGLALIAIAVFLLMRKRRNSIKNQQAAKEIGSSEELESGNKELGSSVESEVGHERHVSELSSSGAISELEGSFSPTQTNSIMEMGSKSYTTELRGR